VLRTTPVLPSVEKKASKASREALVVHTCHDPYFEEQNVQFSCSFVPYDKCRSSAESKAQANKSGCPKGCNLKVNVFWVVKDVSEEPAALFFGF